MSSDRWPIAYPYLEVKQPLPTWREQRPVYVSKEAPCSYACPTNGRIRECVALVKEGDFEGAWRTWVQENPLPRTLGRICYAPCEEACNRGEYDEAVAIRNLERFLGDYGAEQSLRLPEPEERKQSKVACIGSGPAGLAAAYHLARQGYPVTIFEALPVAGGMLRVGVPAFHLPEGILQGEIDSILALGVEMRLNTRVENIDALFDDGYEAVFLAVGAHRGSRLTIPGAHLSDVVVGAELLSRVNLGQPVAIGKRVLVLGGGNVAIDVGRTALRLGADEVHIACVESRDVMPAHPREVEAAEAEGVTLHPARTFTEIIHHGEKVLGVRCLDVTAMEFDQEGNLTVETRAGSDHVLPCDMVIWAIGQVPNLGRLANSSAVELTGKGTITVDTLTLATSLRGVFAGGDAIPDCGMAARALGHGRRGALSIDAYLRGEAFVPPEEGETVTYEELSVNYYQSSARNRLPETSGAQRKREFSEIRHSGYDEVTAQSEAKRCFSCGKCLQCDNCWVFCPDMAVKRDGQDGGYTFEDTYCKGCGICAHECPCGCIEMRTEGMPD